MPQIRAMTIDDIDRVVELEESLFDDSLDFDFYWTEFKLNPFSHYFIYEADDGTLIGHVGLWIDDSAQIITFGIAKPYQKQGYGTKLLEHAIAFVQLQNIPEISLEVRPSNQEALKLYQKHGFVYQTTRPRYYQDGEDAHVYLKKL